jgi:hypothetical protein
MVSHGTAKKRSGHKYSLIVQVAASNSNETAPELTTSDMRALVGEHRVTAVWLERLIGFDLLPEGARAHGGYL